MWQTLLPLIGSAIGGLWQAHREDTSIQRGVADARAAGVDPISALGMAGGAGSSANPFSGGVESYQRSADRDEARRAALAAEDLNRRAVESQIELNKKQGDAMLLEARSRSIADAMGGSNRGQGRPVDFMGIPIDVPNDRRAQDVQDHFGNTPFETIFGTDNFAHGVARQLVRLMGGNPDDGVGGDSGYRSWPRGSSRGYVVNPRPWSN